MHKQYLVLNNLQWLICHKTKANQTKHSYIGFGLKALIIAHYCIIFIVN